MAIKITHNKLKEVLTEIGIMDKPTSVYLWGTIGIGKSMIINLIAQKIAKIQKLDFIQWNETPKNIKEELMMNPEGKYIFADIRLSQTDPSDLRGIPSLTGKNGAVDWQLPMLFKALGHAKAHGTIFFDELNLTSFSTIAAAYQIIHDKQIGEAPINKSISIIAAGNSIEDNANVFDLPKPLQNRFIHFELAVPTVGEWSQWAVEAQINPSIIGYLNLKGQEALFRVSSDHKDQAFPTPRTWEVVSNLIGDRKVRDKKDRSIINTMISAAVGNGIAVEFNKFIELTKDINVEELFNNPKNIKNIDRVDLKYAAIAALTDIFFTKYNSIQNNKKTIKNKNEELDQLMSQVLTVADQFDAEFARLMLRFVIRDIKVRQIASINSKFIEIVPKYIELLEWD